MLRANAASLSPFVVLVGKNATGKSTLMGAIRFVSDLLRGGVQAALANALERDAPSFAELCFQPDDPIEIALEIALDGRRARYEVRVGPDATGAVAVTGEHLFLLPDLLPPGDPKDGPQLDLWNPPEAVSGTQARSEASTQAEIPSGWRKVVAKTEAAGTATLTRKRARSTCFRYGTDRSALGGIPEDLDRFPFSIRVRDFLRDGVKCIELDSRKLREPSVPRSPTGLLPDGSNLARAAAALRDRDRVAFDQWVDHVGTAIEGLQAIDVWERPEDKKLVLQAHFMSHHGGPIRSWTALGRHPPPPGPLAPLLRRHRTGRRGADRRAGERPPPPRHAGRLRCLSQPAEGGQVLVATSPSFWHTYRSHGLWSSDEWPTAAPRIRRGTEVPEPRLEAHRLGEDIGLEKGLEKGIEKGKRDGVLDLCEVLGVPVDAGAAGGAGADERLGAGDPGAATEGDARLVSRRRGGSVTPLRSGAR